MKSTDGKTSQVNHLPEAVTLVKKETIKSFAHTKRVGNYLLGRTLGVGSFAKVKEGLHLTTGEKVAIKVIDKKRAKTDNYVRKNLRREGKLLQLIRHPNVVSLYEVMETDNSYYLVTELCRGGDLMEYITAKKRLPESEVSKFIRQIVSAVDYLHRLGIIHRDLKIENLLLDANKDIKLIDFGLSNFIRVANSPDGTRAQEFCVTQCGSPAYAAPELLNHEKYGLQVDLWSIGVNMYAMLTGGLPFTVEPFNIKALYAKMRDRQMNPVPDDLTRDCKDLLRKFLNPDPARRITITEALSHPWLATGNKPLPRHPCPNKMRTSDLDADILSHMSENLGFRMGEVIKFVTCNTPSPACATYHLYLSRVSRYNLEQRSSGQMTPAGNRKTGEDTRITLHLQDMRAKTEMKNNKEHPPHTSTSGVISPTPRLQSRGLTSVTTEGTDTTYNSKKDSGISTDASNIDSSDRKENRNPLTRYDSIDLNTDKLLPDSPTHSDVSSSSLKDITANSPTLRHFSKRALHEPTVTVSTTVGVVSARQNQHIDIGRELIDKLTTPSKGKVVGFGNSRDERCNHAQGETNALRKSVPSPTRNVSHPMTRQSHAEENSEALVNKERQSIYNKYKLHMKVNTVDKPSNNQIGDENNNLVTGNQPAQIRRYIQNNKLLIRRGMVKTDLNSANKPHDNNVYIVNADPYPQPSPSINRIIPKQLIPFRSAQDRPRLSEIHPLHDLKQYQKAKTSESMSLHGKNVLNTYAGDSSPASKRPVSPPQKPAVVRRKLAKRHRIGELTPPGSHVIQDPDPILNTDLLITDILDMKICTEGMSCDRKSPLPSISPQHSHR
ncbi:serine/threonine-protein kinase MARK2-like [Physella acuta]|uniref:serine/threonine-protein kinase MARK2-like n=1 Tax=Physella acuta TaxID=109671 RepID=UPI0027DC54B0|nr:serine/threonine-protein kinase MARK2-like [Physella acuta]XP_059164645.1 serine/threonine-protein kinase MARK2-like [Physella acuta]XP_059164646.1 serine/threonine-protein kinase MARK2-like [Physella acuta]XP_059164647.1 serine/threonine-protein kinase MARK2-like [Physella acuta]